MDHRLSKNKIFLIGFFIIIFFCVTGQANPLENIPGRTAEMLRMLTGLERFDVLSAESETLIREIFSNKKYQKQADPLLKEFLLSEKNIAGKRYFINELEKVGTSAAAEYLAEMLTIDPSAKLALMTLQRIPGPNVNKLLKKSFPKVSPEIRPGIINALGIRRDESSVGFVSKYIHDENPELARGAISALGKIRTPKATAILTSAVKSGTSKNQFFLMEALMDHAEQLSADGQSIRAFEIYNSILASNPPEMIALAALWGKMNNTTGNPADLLKKELIDSPDELKPGLINLVKNLPKSYLSGNEILQIPGIPDNEKSRLMVILAERNDRSILDEVSKFLNHEEPQYRESAIYCLSRIADVNHVQLLTGLASTRSGRERDLAREAIYRLPGQEVDAFILQKALKSDNESELVDYVRAIGERNIPSSGQVLIQTARNSSHEVRMESLRSLSKVADTKMLGEIVKLLVESENNRERQELERTVFLVSTKEGMEKASTREIGAYLNKIPENEKKSSLIYVLGRIKNPDDLNVLQNYLDSDETVLQLSAIRALSEWPNAGPAKKFKEIIEGTDDLRVKTLALRGFTQIVLNDTGFSNEQKAKELLFGISHAPNVNEKKLIISALGKVPSSESLRLLTDQMKDPEGIRPELEAAILNLIPQLMKQNRENTLEQVTRILKYTENADIQKWINRE